MLLFPRLPNFARACGRVSVGGHPDKRPDSRPGSSDFSTGPIINWQPEAKPAYLVLPEGRDLKQRRIGLFRLSLPSKGMESEEACPSLPTVRRGSPFQSKAVHAVDLTPLAFPTRRCGKLYADVL